MITTIITITTIAAMIVMSTDKVCGSARLAHLASASLLFVLGLGRAEEKSVGAIEHSVGG